MTSKRHHVICIDSGGHGIRKEGIAATDFLPGTFLQFGADDGLEPNDGTSPLRYIAQENLHSIDHHLPSCEAPFKAGNQVYYSVALRGQSYQARLAANQTALKHSWLGLATNGELTVVTDSANAVAVSLEERTGSVEPQLIIMEVI